MVTRRSIGLACQRLSNRQQNKLHDFRMTRKRCAAEIRK